MSTYKECMMVILPNRNRYRNHNRVNSEQMSITITRRITIRTAIFAG